MDFGEAMEKHPDKKDRLTRIKKKKIEYESLIAIKDEPGIKALTEELVSEVNAINTKLLSYDPLTEVQREKLLADKYRCLWFIDKFPEAEHNLTRINDYLNSLWRRKNNYTLNWQI